MPNHYVQRMAKAIRTFHADAEFYNTTFGMLALGSRPLKQTLGAYANI